MQNRGNPETATIDVTSIDVTSMGNAIIDVLWQAPESAIADYTLNKGSMTLIDEDRAEFLTSVMGEDKLMESGGSAGHTAVGLACLGARSAYVGKVKNDELGQAFKDSITHTGALFASNLDSTSRQSAEVVQSGFSQRIGLLISTRSSRMLW